MCVGADPAVHQGWSGPYDVHTTFHEPFVLFGYLAALTSLELVTGIIILPQRQTALVAKQAAEVDLLTGGRFRLGVGLGWNAVEYEALGQNFSDRGAPDERAGRAAAPPVDRDQSSRSRASTSTSPAPGCAAAGPAPDPGLVRRSRGRRAAAGPARLADGWFPMVQPGPALARAAAIVTQAAVAAGRDPSTLGMEGRVNWIRGPERRSISRCGLARGRRHAPVINTMRAGLGSVDEHLPR